MNLCRRCVLFLGSSGLHFLAIMLSFKGFSGFLFLSNRSLLMFLGFSLCFLCIFSSLLMPGMMRKVFLYSGQTQGFRMAENNNFLYKTHCQCRDAEFLHSHNSCLALPIRWLALQRQLAARQFSALVDNAHFSSDSSRFYPSRHFSPVYLQNNQINLKYARNMYEEPKITQGIQYKI